MGFLNLSILNTLFIEQDPFYYNRSKGGTVIDLKKNGFPEVVHAQ